MHLNKAAGIVLAIFVILALLSWNTVIVNVAAVTEVNFTTAGLNWGNGSVNSGCSSAILDSDAGTVTCGSWTSNSGELIIENIGDSNVTLDISSNKDADALVGGSASINSFQWKMAEVESGSCVNIADTSFTNVNTSSPGTRICNLFYPDDTKDSIKIDFKVVVPSDTTKEGAQTTTITATATLV